MKLKERLKRKYYILITFLISLFLFIIIFSLYSKKLNPKLNDYIDFLVKDEIYKKVIKSNNFITNEEVKARLATECCAEHNAQIINGAPLLIATLIVDKRSGFERDGSFSTSRKDAWQAFDNGIATQTLCLAANDLGLGTVVMGLYDIDKASDIIGVPEGQLLMALVAVGYPDEKPSVPKKKTVEDLLSYC